MTPRFLIDAQLPPALAERLAAAGFEASHVHRIGLGGASDLAIWRQLSFCDWLDCSRSALGGFCW
ncbi:DUF5615 family PIN-like protein [Bosea sp. (in: a-proteobacteria)]|uniref:DUF5615 family PIN-like protein n=1 Tax=Bosea sp. (in: a-proteobacteria) TaxID=1871050 RepID=UPI004033B6EF